MFARRTLFTLAVIGCGVLLSAYGLLSAQQAAERSARSSSDRLQSVRAEIQKAKSAMVKEGKYKCCVSPSCDWCLLTDEDSSCGCMANLKAGKEVCPGCGLGWHNGQGIAKGIQKAQVRWTITHEHTH